MFTYYTFNKSIALWGLHFPNLRVDIKQKRKHKQKDTKIKIRVNKDSWHLIKQAQTQTRCCLSTDMGNRPQGPEHTQVPANQRPLDKSTFTKGSLCKHKSYWLACRAAETTSLLHQAPTGPAAEREGHVGVHTMQETGFELNLSRRQLCFFFLVNLISYDYRIMKDPCETVQ